MLPVGPVHCAFDTAAALMGNLLQAPRLAVRGAPTLLIRVYSRVGTLDPFASGRHVVNRHRIHLSADKGVIPV
jgi:hypothetical protein